MNKIGSVVRGSLAWACATCSFCLGVSAATIYYVPSASPYLWTDACWFSDEAGTIASSAPGTADEAYLSADALKSKTLTVPSGAEVAVKYLQLRAAGMTLAIADGATFTTGSTTTFGKANDACLHILNGGSFHANSTFYVCDGGRKRVKLLVDEGGTFVADKQPVWIGNNTSGSASFENHGTAEIGFSLRVGSTSAESSTCSGFLDNYGTIHTRETGSNYLIVGAGPGCKGYMTNRVDGTVQLGMSAIVGGLTNSTGVLVNDGTLSTTRNFDIGGDDVTSARDDITSSTRSVGTVYNSGSLTVGGKFAMGGHRYGKGTLDHDGTLTVKGSAYVAERQQSTASITTHTGSDMTLNGETVFGYYGTAKVQIGGQLYVTNDALSLAVKNSAHATLNIINGGRISGRNRGLNIAASAGTESSSAIVNMSGVSKYENPGVISMGVGTNSVSELNLSEKAVLQSPSMIFVGNGATNAVTANQRTILSLTGSSQIKGMYGTLHVATNRYGRGEVTVADSSSITFSPSGRRNFYIARNFATATGALNLRGGTITMSTNAMLCVGLQSTSVAACNGFLTGWGSIARHSPELTTPYSVGLTMQMTCGAITADGEGVERDLDLSVFRKIMDGGKNLSGTNGWYAVNKGRLYYPCRYSDYVNLGDDYDATDGPYYVNGVHFDFTGKNGNLHGQLYATDRDDIPEGLPADDLAGGTLRLGVWRAGLSSSYLSEEFGTDKATRGSFSSVRATVRYDNFRLNALKDAEGNFPKGLRLVLYRHTGTRWERAASVLAHRAEETLYRITGALKSVDDDWNIGFFAVVAEPPRGCLLFVR